MISLPFLIVIGSLALSFLLLIIILVKDKKLSERESILWLTVAGVVLVLCIFPGLLDWVSVKLQLFYSAALYFFLGIIFILVVLVRNSCFITESKNQIKTLSQRIAFLEYQIRKLNDKVNVSNNS